MKKKQRFMLKALFFGALSLSALIGLSPKAAAVYAEDEPATVDLSAITAHYVAQDGDVLTGALPSTKHYKISIADGATVTLQDASITTVNDSSYDWDGITLQGDANIILKGANTIASNRSRRSGIFVPENKTVTIDGDGSLNVSGNGSAIGASHKKAGGNVTIKGGTIVARAGQSHAAIGAGYQNAPVGNITIEGGDITAYGGSYAAGIGCGESNSCGNITITEGTVRATGGDKAAGIGAGKDRYEVCGDILITGGTVIAQGGMTGAGIGTGGDGGSKVGDITITDTVEEVVAKKGGKDNWGNKAVCSIGAGYTSKPSEPNARFGTVTVLGEVYPNGVTDDTFAYPTFHSVTLNTNGGTIQEGDITRYKEGEVTTLPTNVTKDFYTFKGWYDNENFVGEPITEIGADAKEDMVFWAKWELNPIIDLSTLKGNYKALDGQTLTGTLKGNYKITVAAGANVTLKDVTIKSVADGSYNWAGISLEGDGTLTLEGKNFAKGFSSHYPGVFVPQNKTLTIEGDGSLEAQGHNTGAGIGGGWTVPCGNIVINHGNIIATGGRAAAGIGGGQSGNCGSITIASTVGSLTATRGEQTAYCIGPGNGASCGTVSIDGGEVTGPIAQKRYDIYDVTAEQVLALINGIGEVTYTDECDKAIKSARENYDKLRASEKKKIDAATVQILVDAEATYVELGDTAKANAVIDAINNLPAVGDLTLSDKASVTSARAAYNALTDYQKSKVTADVLSKLTRAEAEINDLQKAATVANMMKALPGPDAIKLSNKSAVEKARAAYDALTDYQKSKIDPDLVTKLNAVESKMRVLVCTDRISKLPTEENVALSNKGAIEAARASYDALSDEEKGEVGSELFDKLEAVEAKLSELKVADAVEKITNLPELESLTLGDKGAVEAARTAYNDLTDAEKAKVESDLVSKLEAVESKIRVLDCSDKIESLPNAEEITLSHKGAIEAARASYDALSDDEKAQVDPSLVGKLRDAENALSVLIVGEAVTKLNNLPSAEDAKLEDKAAVEAARASYDALSDDEKANVDPDLVAKLEAVESVIRVLDCSDKIDKLPAGDALTLADKAAVEAAQAAYEALTAQEKAQISQEQKAKLDDALSAIAVLEVDEAIAALPSSGEITTSDREAIEAAREAYDALSSEEKANVDPDLVAKLEAVESALSVASANALIDALPSLDDLSLEDKEAVEAAKEAFEALSEQEKSQIDASQKTKLEDAVNAIAVLEVNEAINALPEGNEVTSSDRQAIEAAREAYDALSEAQKESISPETYQKLVAAENYLAAAEVKDLIDSIGKVKGDNQSKTKIEAARAAYDALTEEQKALLGEDTLNKLTSAEAAYQEAISGVPGGMVAGIVILSVLTLGALGFLVYLILKLREGGKGNGGQAVAKCSVLFVPFLAVLSAASNGAIAAMIALGVALALIVAADVFLFLKIRKRRKAVEPAEKPAAVEKAGQETEAEEARKAAEEKARQEAEAKKAEEAKKVAEEARKAEEAKKAAEEAREAEEARKAAEEQKRLSLRQSMALARENKGHGSALGKEFCASYLEKRHEGSVEINRRENRTATGLPLADTHFALDGAKRKCFVYVYETEGSPMLLINADERLAEELMERHRNVNPSAFPKSKDAWYSLPLDDTYSEEEVGRILDRCLAHALGRDDAFSLSESLALARENKGHGSALGKEFCASYLDKRHEGSVEINRRENRTSTGLPLADTHFAVGGSKRKCFVYVYETEGSPMLLINAKESLAKEIMERHQNVHPSAFPKSKDAWYSLPLDDSYTEEEVGYILDRCFASALGKEDESLSLKESLALAKSAKGKHAFDKKAICEYLSKYGDEVELNARGDSTVTGLPLADTHYVVGRDGKKRCFAYVYQTSGAMMLLIKANSDYVEALRSEHPAVRDSAFPKSKEPWASVVLDDTYSDDDVKKLLDNLVEINR